MFTVSDIRKEMDRLDTISGLDTRKIPVRVSVRMTSLWGKCVSVRHGRIYEVNELVFADRLLRYATYDHMIEVVRHEYAHAAVVLKHQKHDGHGPLWKSWAARLGCPVILRNSFPEVNQAVAENAARYVVTCSKCGSVCTYQRKSKVVKALEQNPDCKDFFCPRCRGDHFILKARH